MEKTMGKTKKVLKKCIMILALLGSIFAAIKMILVDYSMDEEYQLMMSYRVLSGDRLFGEMWEPHQTSAFICTFLMKIFHTLTGSYTGVLIYIRIVTVFIQLAFVIWLYRCIRRVLDKELSVWICLIFFNVLPKLIQIPEFSNMQLWFTLGCLLAFWEAEYTVKNLYKNLFYILAGIFMSLLVLAYPSSFVLFFVFAAFLAFREKNIKGLLSFVFTCIFMGGGWLLIHMLPLTPEIFIRNVKYILEFDLTHSLDASANGKLYTLLKGAAKAFVYIIAMGLGSAMLILIKKIWGKLNIFLNKSNKAAKTKNAENENTKAKASDIENTNEKVELSDIENANEKAKVNDIENANEKAEINDIDNANEKAKISDIENTNEKAKISDIENTNTKTEANDIENLKDKNLAETKKMDLVTVICILTIIIACLVQAFNWLILGQGYEHTQLHLLVIVIAALILWRSAKNTGKIVKLGIMTGIVTYLAVLYMSDLDFFFSIPHIFLGSLFALILIIGVLNQKYKGRNRAWCLALLMLICFVSILGKGFTLRSGRGNNILSVSGIMKEGVAKGVLANYMCSYIYNSNYEDFTNNIEKGSNILIVTNMVFSPGTSPYTFVDGKVCHFSIVDPTSYDERLIKYWELYPEKEPDVIVLDCWYGQLCEDEDSFIYKYVTEEFDYSEVVDGKYVRFYKK